MPRLLYGNEPASDRPGYTKKLRIRQRWSALQSERASWIPHWQMLGRVVMPRSGRFLQRTKNRGERRHNEILDGTATYALRVLAAGMMAGATSPARPWFRLTTGDPDLDSYQPVQLWTDEVAERMRTVFNKSNTYRALHNLYEELGLFGTAAALHVADYDDVIRLETLTIGEYALGLGATQEVDTLYREFEMSVKQLIEEFGFEQCSLRVQRMFQQGNYDTWIPIVQAIQPRMDRDETSALATDMPWLSCYFEEGQDGRGSEHYLREGGYKRFPALCPRWAVVSGDIYGYSPGMDVLGDVRQLQQEQYRKGQGIDFKVKPPLQLPVSMRGREIQLLPGGRSFYDGASPTPPVQPMYRDNLDLSHLLLDIQDVRQRIERGFFSDLFLMLANATDTQKTATEVAERHEEKLLMLGPMLERMFNELLDPLIDLTFDRMLDVGLLPPPPEELAGRELSVEYVSMLAQAQHAVGINAMDRGIGFASSLIGMQEDVRDRFDFDKIASDYWRKLGNDAKLLVPDDQVMLIRQARAKAMAAKEQSAMMAEQAKAMKDLGTTPSPQGGAAPGAPPSMLTDLTNLFSGIQSPSGVEIGGL